MHFRRNVSTASKLLDDLSLLSVLSVLLRNLIQPEQCSYSFTPSRLDVTLKKRHSQRWGGLEAPATQGLHLHSNDMCTVGTPASQWN